MPSLRYFDQIRYGSIDGLSVLVDPADNALYVTQPTIERLLGYAPDTGRKKLAAKSLKAFAGKDLKPGKLVKAYDTRGQENNVKAIPFGVFLTLVHWEAFEGKGEPQANARALIMAGFADSFSSLVLEQCGVKLSHDERQQTITQYLEGYHAFQDWVRDTHAKVYGCNPTGDYYKDLAITINQFLFNRNHFYRNRLINAKTTELRRLENFQIGFMDTKLARTEGDPAQLVEEYIRRLDC